LVPLAGCPLTRQFFAAPFGVDVGGINEVDPGFQSAIKDPPRLFVGGRDPFMSVCDAPNVIAPSESALTRNPEVPSLRNSTDPIS
jgi:hypothetical protein